MAPKRSAKKAAPARKPAKPAPKKAAATKSVRSAKPAPKKAAPAKKSAAAKSAKKSAASKKAAPAKKAAPGKKSAASAPKKAPAATKHAKTVKPTGSTADKSKPAKKPATPVPTSKQATEMPTAEMILPKPKFSKDGLGYTKDFDLPFVKAQYDMLQVERVHLTGQAKRLEDEAHQLVEEAEMGDVQFDDEGGEGDTMVVERERDLALSAQARDAVAEIDAALERIAVGMYGYSVLSGRPIPKERLEAIPWSSVLVEEKVGGIGRR
jgi:RNA polymerase-binding transcription factor DksA